MDSFDVVKKITGYVQPVGETTEDDRRLANLAEFSLSTERMVDELCFIVTNNNHRKEASIVRSVEAARASLKMLDEIIIDALSKENQE